MSGKTWLLFSLGTKKYVSLVHWRSCFARGFSGLIERYRRQEQRSCILRACCGFGRLAAGACREASEEGVSYFCGNVLS